MNILSETLKTLRKRHSLSQADLSRATDGDERVSVSTIKRIEGANGEYGANARIVKKLAEVLKVEPADLAKEPQARGDPEKRLREIGYRPLKAVVDGETALAYQMVEHLYGIPIRSQILMAPLFSALLAEGSFAWRHERLDEIETCAKTLRSFAEGHLSFAGDVAGVEDGAMAEEQSINSRDVFGRQMVDDWPNQDFDPQERNPFADYLQAFAKEAGAKSIAFDPDGCSDWKTPEGLPEYRVASDVIENLTGGDYWAEFALLRGYARIRDIPEELAGEEAAEDRVKWLASKVPSKERERREKMFAAIDLDGLGLTETTTPSTKEE